MSLDNQALSYIRTSVLPFALFAGANGVVNQADCEQGVLQV